MSQAISDVKTSRAYGWKHWLLPMALIALGILGVVEGARAYGRLTYTGKAGAYGPQQGRKGLTTTITKGRIPLGVFLQFLSDYNGLVLLGEERDVADSYIGVASDIADADDTVVKAILEVNNFRVWRESLPTGREILRVEPILPVKPQTTTSARTYLPRSGRMGVKMTIGEGKIPMHVFLQFLADYTGLGVLSDDDEGVLAYRYILMAAGHAGADEAVVKAILEANKFRVFRETLHSGKEVLKVELMQGARLPPIFAAASPYRATGSGASLVRHGQP